MLQDHLQFAFLMCIGAHIGRDFSSDLGCNLFLCVCVCVCVCVCRHFILCVCVYSVGVSLIFMCVCAHMQAAHTQLVGNQPLPLPQLYSVRLDRLVHSSLHHRALMTGVDQILPPLSSASCHHCQRLERGLDSLLVSS